MTPEAPVNGQSRSVPEEPDPAQGELPRLWGRRGIWQIKLRWAVAPLMLAGVLLGRALGFEFRVFPVLLVAAASPLYNSLFAFIFKRYEARLQREPQLDRFFTVLQVVADYTAIFLLIYFTGGASSPLVVFLIFHVIIAAIQFSPGRAYQFAAWAAGGLWLVLLGQANGWLVCPAVTFRGQPVHVMDRPVYSAIFLLFFSATLFLTAAMVGRIMGRLRQGVGDLTEATAQLSRLTDRLQSLYAMVCAIGAERRLEPILGTVVSELARVMDVPAVSVKLLAEDGKTLRYTAAHGLPQKMVTETVIDLERSAVNRRVIEGETLVQSRLDEEESLQLRQELVALGIQSAALAPLKGKDRAIGTLGIYSHAPDRFQVGDTDFLKLAAELVAIAIEDARANEAVEVAVRERTQFMLRVAHNLRAPLSAAMGMLDLVSDGYLGETTAKQTEYLERVERRLRALDQTVGELLAIAQARDWSREIPDVVVDLEALARRTERTFQGEAALKGLRFKVVTDDDLPPVDSGTNLLDQLMENLVSNAIKYTPEKGEVEVSFARRNADEVRITVRDTGIGIPAAEQDKLFEEFFRASNAKKVTTSGTGLGLVLVKQTVERHGGQLMLASQEGEGTTVVVDLPIRQEKAD